MRILKLLIVSIIFVSYSCEDDIGVCDKFNSRDNGDAYAEQNYGNYIKYSSLGYEGYASSESPDGAIYDKTQYSFTCYDVDKYCYINSYFSLDSLPKKTNDTIKVKSGYFLLQDYDATIETYYLMKGDSVNNWLVFKSFGKDTTIVQGAFQLSFKTGYKYYLNGERERWDDPKRPNIITFKNGEFTAINRGK